MSGTIAIATLLTTIYAGYAGSPWWAALICTLTLTLALASMGFRLYPHRSAIASIQAIFLGSFLHCLLVSGVALGLGQLLQVLAA